MATTEQFRTTYRDQPPVVRRYAKSLEEIIVRFHDSQTSIEERHGLLLRIAIWCETGACQSQNAIEAAVFLMEIGSEGEPCHPSTVNCSNLRRHARIVLARNICRQLWNQWEWHGRCTPLGHEAINRLTVFYTAHKDHADLNARDLVVVHKFLEQVAVDSDQRISHDDAVCALVATGAWKAILEHRLYEAIPWLCERLAKALGRQTVLTDWLWRPVLSGDDPDDLIDCILQAGLSTDDTTAFSEEIQRVVALCGMALGSRSDDDDDAEREAAKALLVLVGRVNHAVFNLRG